MKELFGLIHFRRLVGAWSIGNFADSALYLTLAVWTKELTGSSGAAGLIFFCLGAPVLASPLFGLLADRVRRRPLLIVGNLGAALIVLALLAVETATDVWILYAVTIAYGALGVLNGAAQSGLLRTMLNDDQLGPANAILSTIDQGLRILTPVVGAGLYALWGGPVLAVGTAVLLTITATGLALVRIVEPKPAGRPAGDSGMAALLAGFSHLWRTVEVRNMVIGLAIALSVLGVFDSLLFVVVEHGLQRPPEFFGVLMSAQGAGSIIGGLTAVRLMKAVGPTRSVVIGLLTLASGSIPFVTGNLILVLVGMVAAGVAIPWAFVAMVTTRQRLTPHDLQGRAASATGIFLQLPQLASTAAGALAVTLVDYRLLTVIAAIVIAAGAFWLAAQRFNRRGPIAAGPAAAPAPDPNQLSGGDRAGAQSQAITESSSP